MEGSSRNENTLIQDERCVFLNEVKCEGEVMEETQEHPSLQSKESKVPKKNEKIKQNFKLLSF
jgi:hypothetical protein